MFYFPEAQNLILSPRGDVDAVDEDVGERMLRGPKRYEARSVSRSSGGSAVRISVHNLVSDCTNPAWCDGLPPHHAGGGGSASGVQRRLDMKMTKGGRNPKIDQDVGE